MTESFRVVVLLAVALVALGGVGYAAADSDYGVRADDSIDVPNRTYTFQGAEYTVTSIGKVPAGDVLRAETSGPENADFDVNLYNSDQRIVGGEAAGDGTVSFRTNGLEPGTYALVVYTPDGSLVSPQPVVVAGYETTLDAPAEVNASESADVTVELTDEAGLDDPESVELVVVRDGTVVRTVGMTQEGTYEFATELSSLEPGEYDVYANVRNETTVNGEHEVVGLSDRVSLTVSDGDSDSGSGPVGEADPEGTETESNADVSNGGGGDSDVDESDAATTAVSTTATTASDEVSSEGTTAEATTATETPDSSTTTADSEPTTAPASTDTAATETATAAGGGAETETTMPNRAPAMVALLLVLLAIRARR